MINDKINAICVNIFIINAKTKFLTQVDDNE